METSVTKSTFRDPTEVDGEERLMSAPMVCSNCVMDTSDIKITFDQAGVCDHCRSFLRDVLPHWRFGRDSEGQLNALVDEIRSASKDQEFDSIIGLSGGLDSSYMLHNMVKNCGLRPLVFHVDGGWNSELAVHNIEVLVDGLDLELFTEVINWEEMKDFQLSFLKAGVSNIDIPQDHAFVATLYKFAERNQIKFILNGGNYSTECVRNPKEWIYYGTDMALLRDIHAQFGTRKLRSYPFSNVLKHKLWLPYFKGVRVVKPLNLLPYERKSAIEELSTTYGWKSYPQKHFESRFTKFYESFWLPERFGYDTRKVQFSSLILTGQMTRDEALNELKSPAYDPEFIDHEFEYIATKLDISVDELWSYFHQPIKSYRDYKNMAWMFEFGARAMKRLGLERAVKR